MKIRELDNKHFIAGLQELGYYLDHEVPDTETLVRDLVEELGYEALRKMRQN